MQQGTTAVHQTSQKWRFWIDVGGTFSDLLALSPEGHPALLKTLSSGRIKGVCQSGHPGLFQWDDASLGQFPSDFFTGYECLWGNHSQKQVRSKIIRHEQIRFSESSKESNATFFARFTIQPHDSPKSAAIPSEGTLYELTSHEESAFCGIRQILRLPLSQPLPEIDLSLGTTRGTNALLTRNGAKTALLTTRGLGDLPRIGSQERSRLFALQIEKPAQLFCQVVEIDERISALGEILVQPDAQQIREQLRQLLQQGIQSIAISFLHAWKYPQHEQLVALLAKEAGFIEVCTSHQTAAFPKLVPRTETTVLNAYLTPVLRSYLNSLSRGLDQTSSPQSRQVRLMTSAGTLVSASNFRGSDSVLSGPAGGVVGFAKAAEAAGFSKAIGIDMGGTSTDVAIYAGEFLREFEGVKAGVKLIGDRLAIETVAAGGGSVCDLVGRQLVVGPQSAGASPGPACYGQGGPLTITDCNLWLGRIDTSRFPFPLDREATRQRLHETLLKLQSVINFEQAGVKPITSIEELAAGFLEIANATMARAIRKISIEKGQIPEDYLLVAFGGAAPQHACGIARLLNIQRVLIHPLAALLCAYGLSQANVTRRGERPIYQRLQESSSGGQLSEDTLKTLLRMAGELEADLRQQIDQEQLPNTVLKPLRLDVALCYAGAESVLEIRLPDDLTNLSMSDLANQFRRLHRSRYGYDRPAAQLELVALRGELSATREPISFHTDVLKAHEVPHTAFNKSKSPLTQRWGAQRLWVAGNWHEAACLPREKLTFDDVVTGPALITDTTTTSFIDIGYEARRLPGGELLISKPEKAAEASSSSPSQPPLENSSAAKLNEKTPEISPVEIEVFHQRLASIADEMGIKLQQTAISTNVKERLDYSCAIFTRLGELVVNAPHVPVHLGAMSESVKAILKAHPNMEPGDVFLTNDPFAGGSHLPDLTVISPVFISSLTANNKPYLAGFVANRAHHAEIGGIVPGSMPPFSKCLAEEGVLLSNLRIVHGGVLDEAGLMARWKAPPYPSRMPEQNLADLQAQIAANTRGAQLVADFVQEQSISHFELCLNQLQQIASTMIRQLLGKLPPGEYPFIDHLDDGSPIRLNCRILKSDSSSNQKANSPVCQLDFTGTGPVLKSNLNANRAIVTASVMYTLRCLVEWYHPDQAHTHFPLNSGVLEPVEIVLPECLLNPPAHHDPKLAAAVVGGNVETSQRLVDVLLGVFGVAAASQGTMNNLTFGNDRFGYYETICGGTGATSRGPGADAIHSHMTNTRLTDPEILEQRYPLRVKSFSIRQGSGGAGQYRGGHGVTRQLEFLEPLSVSILSERRGAFRPYGVAGGEPGQPGQNLLTRRQTGETIDLGGKATLQVETGDLLTIHTPGGGGWGSPDVST